MEMNRVREYSFIAGEQLVIIRSFIFDAYTLFCVVALQTNQVQMLEKRFHFLVSLFVTE